MMKYEKPDVKSIKFELEEAITDIGLDGEFSGVEEGDEDW